MANITGNAPQPPREICPLCGHDDNVSPGTGPDPDAWLYTCSSGRHHPDGGSYTWPVPIENVVASRDGIMSDLGLFDDLPRCLIKGEPWVEHGVVEYRYKLLRPDVYFDELLPRYGHRKQSPKSGTLSAILGAAMRHLSKQGIVAFLDRQPGTGYWSYLSWCGYWALPPAPDAERQLTWVQFADREHLGPNDWDLTRPVS